MPSVDHFGVPHSLSFKTSLSAKSLLWISLFIHIEIRTHYHNKISHLESLLKRELGNGTTPCFPINITLALISQQKFFHYLFVQNSFLNTLNRISVPVSTKPLGSQRFLLLKLLTSKIPFQLSPVAIRNKVSIAVPKSLKCAWGPRPWHGCDGQHSVKWFKIRCGFLLN